ncbi:thiopurine S-methyltransferase [Pseudomonas sp. XS1P51]
MTGRDNNLWLELWRKRTTDFHQIAVNPLLSRFWPALGLEPGCLVFVPLCGKSLDMLWLAEQGHEVIGVELSPLATRAFFRENRLHPTRTQEGQFTRWQHGRISILCGDYFALTSADLGDIDTVYDRAALTALPMELRQRYVAHLRRIVPASANVFLLTIEDAQASDTLQQTMGVDQELAALYRADFEINLAHVESLFENDPQAPQAAPTRAEYKVYRLTGKSAVDAAKT